MLFFLFIIVKPDVPLRTLEDKDVQIKTYVFHQLAE